MTRFSSDRKRLAGWPVNIYTEKAIRSPIVAAVHDERYGITYMFAAKTSDVYQYDEIRETLVQSYPVGIDTIFGGVPTKIISAFRQDGKLMFRPWLHFKIVS